MEISPNLSESARRDTELIIAARSGSKKAYSQIMSLYKGAIYFMLLRMVENKLDAEELTFEAFRKAFVNIHKYEPKFAFSTWLFCIASNNAIDHMHTKRVVTVPVEPAVHVNKTAETEFNYYVKTDSDNPAESYVKEQNPKLLHKSISTLKPQYRTLLEMRYFMEYSYIEIAKQLNSPFGTVKVQLFRSREILFDLLKNTEMRY